MKFLITICSMMLALTISATQNVISDWDYKIDVSAEFIELESVKPEHLLDTSIFTYPNNIYQCLMKANGRNLYWNINQEIVENSENDPTRFLIGLWGIDNHHMDNDNVLINNPIKTRDSVIQLLQYLIFDNVISENTKANKDDIHLLVLKTKYLQGDQSISGNSFILWNTFKEPNPPEFLRDLTQGKDYISFILFPAKITQYKINWNDEKSLTNDQTGGSPANTERNDAQSDSSNKLKNNVKFDESKIEDFVKKKYSCVLEKQAFEIDIKNNKMYQPFSISVNFRKEVYTNRVKETHPEKIEYALKYNTYNVTGKRKNFNKKSLLSQVIPKLHFKDQAKAIILPFNNNQLKIPEIIDSETISFYSKKESVWLKAISVSEKNKEIEVIQRKRPKKFLEDHWGNDVYRPVTAKKENCIIKEAKFKEEPRLVLSLTNTEFSKDYLSATYTMDIVSEKGKILEYKTQKEKITFKIEAQKIPVILKAAQNFPELKSLEEEILSKLKFKYDTLQLKIEKGIISFPTAIGDADDITLERVEFPYAELTGAKYDSGKFILALKKRAGKSINYTVARKTSKIKISGYTANLYYKHPHENKIKLSNPNNLIKHASVEYELVIKHNDYQTNTLTYTNNNWPSNKQVLMDPKMVSFKPVLLVVKDKYNADYSVDTPKYSTITHPKPDFHYSLDLNNADKEIWEFTDGTSKTKIELDDIKSNETVKIKIQRKSVSNNFSLKLNCDNMTSSSMPLEYHITGFEKNDDQDGNMGPENFDLYAKFPNKVLPQDKIEINITKPPNYNIYLDGEDQDHDILSRTKTIIFKKAGSKKISCYRIPSFDFFYFDIADLTDKKKTMSYFEEKLIDINQTNSDYFMYLCNDRNPVIAKNKDEYKNILNGMFKQRNTPPAIVVSDLDNIDSNLNKTKIKPSVKTVTFHFILSDSNYLSKRARNRIFDEFLKQFKDSDSIKIIIYDQDDLTKIKTMLPNNDVSKPINY